jgi:tetratricopeptide (TPR) repeat protein
VRYLRIPFALLIASASAACQSTTEAASPRRALEAERQGHFAEAADAYLELSRAQPDDHQWVVDAGRCLGRSGRLRQALDVLDAGRKRFPEIIEIRTLLAQTLLQLAEDPETLNPEVLVADAGEIAEAVLHDAPDNEDGVLLLAQIRYLQGRWEDAVRLAEGAVQRFPRRSGAHVLLGRIATDRFRKLLEEHERLQPTGQEAADMVAAIHAQRQLAHRSYERAAELEPGRAFPHVARANLALLDHRSDEARRHLIDALVVDPDVAIDHTLFERELTWEAQRGAYAEAARRYAASPSAKPAKLSTLRWYEGRALFRGEQWADAKACFERALAENPGATASHYYIALCAYRLGDHDGAEQHAAAYAAEGAPAFADVLRALPGEQRGEIGAIVQFLADRSYVEGRIEHSRDLNHVIACLHDTADAWNNHAFLCRETGRYEQALTSYEYAQMREPDSPQLLNDTAAQIKRPRCRP